MDMVTYSALLAAIYPPLKDLITYIMNNKEPLNDLENHQFKTQITEMISVIQNDISILKNEIYEVKNVTAQLHVDMEERGNILWNIPRGANCIQTWRYKRARNKIIGLAEQSRSSMIDIIDAIACCSGILAGRTVLSQSESEPTWASDLGRAYEDALVKTGTPQRYSINELTNELESFLDQSRISLQNLAHEV